jgi:hypothetical protein
MCQHINAFRFIHCFLHAKARPPPLAHPTPARQAVYMVLMLPIDLIMIALALVSRPSHCACRLHLELRLNSYARYIGDTFIDYRHSMQEGRRGGGEQRPGALVPPTRQLQQQHGNVGHDETQALQHAAIGGPVAARPSAHGAVTASSKPVRRHVGIGTVARHLTPCTGKLLLNILVNLPVRAARCRTCGHYAVLLRALGPLTHMSKQRVAITEQFLLLLLLLLLRDLFFIALALPPLVSWRCLSLLARMMGLRNAGLRPGKAALDTRGFRLQLASSSPVSGDGGLAQCRDSMPAAVVFCTLRSGGDWCRCSSWRRPTT